MRYLLLLVMTTSLFAQRGEDGLTYSERRQQWLNDLPSPQSSLSVDDKRLYFSGWLQKGIYNDVVSEALDDILGDFWLTGGRSHHGYMIALIIKYGSKGSGVIDIDDEMKVRDRYASSLIERGDVYGDLNPNKQMWAMAGVYLYAHYFDRDIRFQHYGHRVTASPDDNLMKQNWPSFSYDGNRYEFGGGPYNARQLAEDYIKNQLESWYLDGNREMDSLNYHRAFVGSMLLLYDMAEDNDLRNRARMGAEIAMLDALMDFGGSEWGGTLGRTDFSRMNSRSVFPFYEFFGKSREVTSRPDIKILYTLDYEPPALLVDLAVLTDERDDYYHFHKEHHDSPLKNADDGGKWNYVTPYYNIGSNIGGFNSGWQVTIRGTGDGKFIRMWINDSDTFDNKTETRFLGNGGLQFRNAIFAQIGASPIVHEANADQPWDEESRESGWQFKRLDKVFVAIGLDATTASIELAIRGVDYDSYDDFKAAVKQNAFLDASMYRTSKGVEINPNDECGLRTPGDCSFPFDRLETEYDGGKMIRWSGDTMIVSYRGKTLSYDFGSWRTDEPEQTDQQAPARPRGVKVQVGN